MSRGKKGLTVLQMFGLAFFLYFGIHMIVGFRYCINTDYATCPGHDAEVVTFEDDFDD
jgi:hypothetical protein